MNLDPTLKKGMAVALSAVGMAGLSGCGVIRNVYTNPSDQGVYGKNSWAYLSKKDSNHLLAKCVGNALVIETFSSQEDTHQRTWLNDTSCADGQLTRSDNFAGEAAEAARDFE